MRWLWLVFASACGFSAPLSSTPGDGSRDGIDAIDSAIDAPDGMSPANCAAVEIEAMGAHTCVRRNDGEVWCWGRNVDDEVGVPSSQQPCGGMECVRVPTKLTFP